MKPPSDDARQLLEQYRASLTLGAEQKARLASLVEERALRGDLPRFDVADAAPSVPESTLIQKLWSSTVGKLALGVLALGAAGTAGQQLLNDEPARSWSRPPAAQVAPLPAAPRASALPATPRGQTLPAAEPKADSKPLEPRASSSHSEKVVAPPADNAEPTIDEEVKLVNAAQAALRAGDTRRSFDLLAQHAARFPNGKLVTLRQVTQMMTLCQAGRRAEARRQATAFLASKPSSPFAERVKSICVD